MGQGSSSSIESAREINESSRGSVGSSAFFSPVHQGSAHVTKEIENFIKWSNSGWKLEKLFYCHRVVRLLAAKQQHTEEPGLINHDYLIIKAFQNENDAALYLKAEKLDAPQAENDRVHSEAGIYISIEENFEEANGTIAHSIYLFKAPICLAEFVDLVKQHDPNYNLLEKNCWEYARATMKRILLMAKDLVNEEQKKLIDEEASILEKKLLLESLIRVLKLFNIDRKFITSIMPDPRNYRRRDIIKNVLREVKKKLLDEEQQKRIEEEFRKLEDDT